MEYDQYIGDDAIGGPIFRKTIGYEVTARTVGSVGVLYDFNFNAGGKKIGTGPILLIHSARETKGYDYHATTEASNCCRPSTDGTECC